jgi:hypothetical protein
MPAYRESFPVGTKVRIADLPRLREFKQTWAYHNKLQQEQLEHAGIVAEVQKVGFYHGGDVLYSLVGVPGVWHESCLDRAGE